jgi:hypothetical protein
MKNTISKVLVAVTFGLVLNSSVMAGEDVDLFTLSFQNNNSIVNTTGVQISKVSYTPGVLTTGSVLAMCYDSVK